MEVHNYIGQRERYRHPLRRICNIIRISHSSLDNNNTLRIDMKPIKHTMWPNVLVSSMLVFGTMPTFPTPPNAFPKQAERFSALPLARSEKETITAENSIKVALRSKVPPAKHYRTRHADKSRVHREHIGSWKGPYDVTKVLRKSIHVSDFLMVKHFNISSILPMSWNNNDMYLKWDMDNIKKDNNPQRTWSSLSIWNPTQIAC